MTSRDADVMLRKVNMMKVFCPQSGGRRELYVAELADARS